MKKFVTAILAILYLGTSMGATIHMHYCMGKLVSWGLVDHEGKNCGTCGMPKKISNKQCVSANDCCKDEHKLIKSDKDQKISQPEYQFLKLCQDVLAVNDLSFSDIHISSLTIEHPKANAPPRPGQVPLFLLNRNFRI